jgi:hypothetical protein
MTLSSALARRAVSSMRSFSFTPPCQAGGDRAKRIPIPGRKFAAEFPEKLLSGRITLVLVWSRGSAHGAP